MMATRRESNAEVLQDDVVILGYIKEAEDKPVSAVDRTATSSESDVAAQETVITTAYQEPPNGGLTAWLQVVGAFFMIFNSWGTINTFGVFQTYYEISFGTASMPSNISWIGSIQAFLLLVVGVATGPLYDAGYFRALITCGSLLIVLGLMMLSLCTQYWQVLLTQALCIGVGTGCIFIPSIAILPQYFTTRKALAMSIVASGSSVGSVIYPVVFHQLQPRIGFPRTVRIMGFIALATCSISIATMRVRQMTKQKRLLIDLPAFKEPPYAFFCGAMVCAYIGLFVPIFYIQSYAVGTGAVNEPLAFYLIAILNAASVPGRILSGILTISVGPLNMLLPAATITGILALCWTRIHTSAGMITFALLYGFFSGCMVSLQNVVTAVLTPDMSKLGTRMGMLSLLIGMASLCGAPVAGAILSSSGGWLGVQLFAGLWILMTGLLLFVVRYAKVGTKLWVRV